MGDRFIPKRTANDFEMVNYVLNYKDSPKDVKQPKDDEEEK